MKQWPDVYYFGTPIGPVFKWFAWYPVRTWWGKWVWLETVQVARIAKIDHLDGPDWAFWSYEKVGPVQECTDQNPIKKDADMGEEERQEDTGKVHGFGLVKFRREGAPAVGVWPFQEDEET